MHLKGTEILERQKKSYTSGVWYLLYFSGVLIEKVSQA